MQQAITVYTKDGCVQCKMTKHFLAEHDVQFEEKNINTEPQYLHYLKDQGFQSLPIVMAPDQKPIVGFRPDQLKQVVQL
ncbi:glutaredoxin-like protein NrdH [Lactobacillus sp. DCY120]|uniref:Glutaredoxin-like protein NrdH n=1 Tax=Bombilactobacillus apium TaxID=2675299 RepID=A0A850RD10_9LACO|nr:glutaredoxin-like protein NrdH [Bombilactobacillus apium]NVY97166.1 glutaredoxin-like protein NrdH [Bombilactobacillus apium]